MKIFKKIKSWLSLPKKYKKKENLDETNPNINPFSYKGTMFFEKQSKKLIR